MLLSKEKQKKDTKVKGKWIKLYNPLQQTKKRKKKKSQKQIKIFHLVVDCVTLLLPWRSLCTIHNTTQKTFSEIPSLSVIKLRTTKKKCEWNKEHNQETKKKKTFVGNSRKQGKCNTKQNLIEIKSIYTKGCVSCVWLKALTLNTGTKEKKSKTIAQ